MRNLFSFRIFAAFVFLWSLCILQTQAGIPSAIDRSLDNARAIFKDGLLTVTTGKVIRQWRWTGSGFLTISLKNVLSGKEWCGNRSGHLCDWNLPTKIDDGSTAKLISVDCTETDDEHFTSNHLLLSALIHYDTGLDLRFLIRVYPDGTGIWTALEVKSLDSFSSEGIPADLSTYKSYGSDQPLKIARNEFVPVDFSQKNQRRYWGIYNDPGHRVNTKNMVLEEVVKGYPLFQDEENTWASGLSVEAGNEGLILLKESNKTVNKYGLQTGAFYCTPTGVEVTGWGLRPDEISKEFKRCWPTWTILYSGGQDEMELAFKQFDRTRYPVSLKTDMHILIDTWGSDFQHGDYNKYYGRENSEFPVVEKEIKSASDLGIDIVRIDDGWQDGDTFGQNIWHPNPAVGYSPHWENVIKLSKEYNVRIGLWAAVRFISPEELLTNQKELGVATWKFDFDKLDGHDSFANRLREIREFIIKSGYSTQTSWCPEYDDQRYGWYSAVRECGPMYFQNIQNNFPNHLVYVPYITLRHHWMLSKFYNMNDLQCNWQNPSLTNPKFSDANLYSQSYCALSAFAGAPSCFMLTQLLQPAERDELKRIIAIYKANRKEIFESYVFPIGSEPDNESWTGFQICNPEKKTGYLMIFRELYNKERYNNMKLRFLKDKSIRITDLVNGNSYNEMVNDKGIKLSIEKPAGYLFLKYEIAD